MRGLSATPPDPGEVSQDGLLGGAVQLYQPVKGYRAAIDPVLLAAATPVGAIGLEWDPDLPAPGTVAATADGSPQPARCGGATVLDLGCGVGAVSLCLLARVTGLSVTGIELQPAIAAVARQNTMANRVEERFEIVEGEATAAPGEVPRSHFDLVVMNPPYNAHGTVTRPPEDSRAIAHVEGATVLADWIVAARRHLKPRGWLTFIHRADRFPEAISALEDGFGSISLMPIHPHEGQPAGRILVRARKGGRAPARLLPGLIAHRESGGYTAEVEQVLRGTVDLDNRFGR